ncbi:MAG: hypothetical protein AAF236_10865 [Verrucomicrobiota bacterium]
MERVRPFRQRFFPPDRIFPTSAFLFAVILTHSGIFAGTGKRHFIDEKRVTFELPYDWEESELNADDVLAGYQSKDQTTSIFFKDMGVTTNATLSELMDALITGFEETFELKGEDNITTGVVKGPEGKTWAAISAVIEGNYDRGDKVFGVQFHVVIFDTGSRLYQVQASTVTPVEGYRARQIGEILKSIYARP